MTTSTRAATGRGAARPGADRAGHGSGWRTVWLIRHGPTRANVDGIVQGWRDEPLGEAGRAAVAEAALRWTGRDVHVVVSSPLARARETALGLFGRIDEVDAAFVEVAVVGTAGLSHLEAAACHRDVYQHDGWLDPRRAGGAHAETAGAVWSRARGGLLRVAGLAEAGATVAVVTHGDVVRTVVSHGTGREWGQIENLAAAQLRVDPTGACEVVGVERP